MGARKQVVTTSILLSSLYNTELAFSDALNTCRQLSGSSVLNTDKAQCGQGWL